MKGSGVKKFLWYVWRIIRWPIAVCFVLYVGLVLWELVHLPKATAETVAAIHAERLTMADVDGKHLPPQPDAAKADATVEGIDANNNGIRDDVELAIFNKYPNDIKVRAAELQYAMELQNGLTHVFSKGTYIAAVQEKGRGSLCITDTAPRVDLNDTDQVINNSLNIATTRKTEVEELIFNTSMRKGKQQSLDQFTTSFSESKESECDLNL